MARTKKRARSKPKAARSRSLPFHAFWSGSLSFGLVNVPVLLFPASRHSGVRLRLLSPQGSPLERRFFCPQDGKEVSPDEIVRGYELDDGSYIIVDDHELEAIEPQKTREIDLRQFVDLAELPPALLERGYYLTPLKETTKAYRLLAEVMERTRRAGIATFVMRDREYLVAIFARRRDPLRRDAPLPGRNSRSHDDWLAEAVRRPQRRRVSAFRALHRRSLQQGASRRAELADETSRRSLAIIDAKEKDRSRSGSHRSRRRRAPIPIKKANVDLLETIRRSLRAPRAARRCS